MGGTQGIYVEAFHQKNIFLHRSPTHHFSSFRMMVMAIHSKQNG